MTDPVEYRVTVQHWQDGSIVVHVYDVGDSEADRQSIAFALREAADQVANGQPVHMDKMN